jgi:hypothetical protein
MILTGENRRSRRETCPSATSSTTNPTWSDRGANSGLRGEKPATNCLSYARPNRVSCLLRIELESVIQFPILSGRVYSVRMYLLYLWFI